MPDIPWGSLAAWQEANRTLADHLARRRAALGPAYRLAREVHQHLTSLFPILENLCGLTCPWCVDPCCLKAKVWFDFKDLLFLHFSGHYPPEAQAMASMASTCRYCGPRGCTLPREERPWMCTLYLCPAQTSLLRRGIVGSGQHWQDAVDRIKKGRIELENRFIAALR